MNSRQDIIDNLVRTQVASLENIGMEVENKMLDQMIQFAIIRANERSLFNITQSWDSVFKQSLLLGYFLGTEHDPYTLAVVGVEFGIDIKKHVYSEMNDKTLSNKYWLRMPNLLN